MLWGKSEKEKEPHFTNMRNCKRNATVYKSWNQEKLSIFPLLYKSLFGNTFRNWIRLANQTTVHYAKSRTIKFNRRLEAYGL